MQEENGNLKVKEKELVLKRKEYQKENGQRGCGHIQNGLDKISRPRLVFTSFESQTSKNLTLENASKLKTNIESFKRVILSQDLAKEDRKEMMKLFLQKQKEINAKGEADKWTVPIGEQPGSFHRRRKA